MFATEHLVKTRLSKTDNQLAEVFTLQKAMKASGAFSRPWIRDFFQPLRLCFFASSSFRWLAQACRFKLKKKQAIAPDDPQ